MTKFQTSILEKAKQGEPQAIAAFLNRNLFTYNKVRVAISYFAASMCASNLKTKKVRRRSP